MISNLELGALDELLTVPLSEDTHEAMRWYAERESRTIYEVARQAIEEYLDQHQARAC